MNIIKTHNITLYRGGKDDIVLRPLSDEHLPYLYKLNADPEVLYWTEGGADNLNLSYGREAVHQIYGGVSQNAFCFLIEANGTAIGECWLQGMNLSDVKAMYAPPLDVRRIDMCIGEKAYWGCGIGTQLIDMMVDFAFNGEHTDVLHFICGDSNIRLPPRLGEERIYTNFIRATSAAAKGQVPASLPSDTAGIHRPPPISAQGK